MSSASLKVISYGEKINPAATTNTITGIVKGLDKISMYFFIAKFRHCNYHTMMAAL